MSTEPNTLSPTEQAPAPDTRAPAGPGQPGLALLAGGVAATLGAAAWAGITVVTHYQLGLVAVAIGFAVGWAVRRFGQGSSLPYALIGAAWALVGCIAGNLLSTCGFIAIQEQIAFSAVLSGLTAARVGDLLSATFDPMDLVFYAIATYEGFKLSIPRDGR